MKTEALASCSGESRVHGRGTPRRKNVSLLVADGEWDARRKLISRPENETSKKDRIRGPFYSGSEQFLQQ